MMLLHFDSYCISVERHKGLSFISVLLLCFWHFLIGHMSFIQHFYQTEFTFLRNNRCKIFLFPSSFRMACVYLYHFCIIKAFECRRHPNTEPVLIDEEVRSSLLTLRFFCKNKLKAGCLEASLFRVNIDAWTLYKV